ncbi:hypothetical protein HPB47_016788 [Ixodes persulcatus]|uniref:Uncharacterized protein n=1 Tax=Ixodes persulcatus TaxID=34615 RepID=A0AC60QPY9_IXOPE|nr:hypothetical protein HPB47_016788 [Ixodes persulcatus]
MEHALLTRINSHLEDTSAYPHSIIGFRAHLSTQDAMLQLKHQILDDKSRHTKAILGLDLERAFDSVAHPTILERISFLNLGERTYNYVRDFLLNRRAFLSVGDIQSEEFTLGCVGTPQGSVISPMPFNLVMLGLEQELQKLDGIEHTIYADDITIWATTGSDGQIETALQDAIDASELLLYRPTLRGRPPLGSTHKRHYEEIQLRMRDGGTIPVVSTIWVLGMTIEANGANSTAISKILRQTANTSRLLKRVTNRRQGMKEESLIRLVHSFRHLSRHAEKTKLDIIIRGAYKLALGLPNSTSTELLLQLGLQNTLDELIEAQRRSHLERLTLPETGRHILTKLGITYHPYGDTTGVTFVDAAEYQYGHRFAAATTVGGSLKRAASIVTQNAETAEEVAIALATLDPHCHTIVSDSRTAISNYMKVRISHQALRILHQSPHSTEIPITLVWFPAHAGDVTHSVARGLVNRAGGSAGAPAERDRLTSYNDLTKSFYLERRTFPAFHHKLNRAQATTLRLLQTNTWHAALRSSHLDDQLWATQQACEAAKRQDLDVPTWEA